MDFIAAILELFGSYMLGEKIAIGFIVNALACVCWAYVAIRRRIFGLLLVVAPAFLMNIWNWMKWLEY